MVTLVTGDRSCKVREGRDYDNNKQNMMATVKSAK
jgi:hypothetical protein